MLVESNPSKCPNGPDENGDWPCDPIVYGTDGIATCSVCGFEAPWPDSDRLPESNPSYDPIRPEARDRYVSVVIDRKADGKIVAGPYRRYQDAQAARTRLRNRGHKGELWIGTLEEVRLGAISY